MTYGGGKPHPAGDRGQRYEVTFFNPEEGERQALGWCATPEGAQRMKDAVHQHPTWESPQVTDLAFDAQGVLRPARAPVHPPAVIAKQRLIGAANMIRGRGWTDGAALVIYPGEHSTIPDSITLHSGFAEALPAGYKLQFEAPAGSVDFAVYGVAEAWRMRQ